MIVRDIFLGLVPLLILVAIVVLAIYSYRRWGAIGLIGALFFWPLLVYLYVKDEGSK